LKGFTLTKWEIRNKGRKPSKEGKNLAKTLIVVVTGKLKVWEAWPTRKTWKNGKKKKE